MNKKLIDLNPNDILVKKRPRDDDGDLSDLTASVKTIGLLHPLIVDADNVLIAGGRRLAACRAAGLAAVPAFKLDAKADPMLRLNIQAAENLCRKPLSPEELEAHIQIKKDTFRNGGRLGGLWSRLSRLFKG